MLESRQEFSGGDRFPGYEWKLNIIQTMTIYSQWPHAVNDLILAMTLYFQWPYTINDLVLSMTLLSLTLYSQWPCTFNDLLLSITLYFQWPCISNDLLLSITLYFQWPCTVNDLVLSITLCCQWRCTSTDFVRSMTFHHQWPDNVCIVASLPDQWRVEHRHQLPSWDCPDSETRQNWKRSGIILSLYKIHGTDVHGRCLQKAFPGLSLFEYSIYWN